MKIKRLDDESTTVLFLLTGWYFLAYVGTGVFPKIFTKGLLNVTKITQMENLYYSTLGGVFTCLALILLLGWPRHFKSTSSVTLGSFTFPKEFLYLIPSGICTAVIVPTTTMMYTFGVSVMIAMVTMRGCIVVLGRIVDAVQIQQGILKKEVSWEENVAVLFAIGAVLTALFNPPKKEEDYFELFRSIPAMITMGLYVGAYAIRLYIMNYYKNTKGVMGDNRAFFAVEQTFCAVILFVVMVLVIFSGSSDKRILEIQAAASKENLLAVLGGIAFGLATIPSVFLFMLKGRTGTFSALVNRLTSLIAGTAATLLLIPLKQPAPSTQDWIALALVLMAIGFLGRVEWRKARAAVRS